MYRPDHRTGILLIIMIMYLCLTTFTQPTQDSFCAKHVSEFDEKKVCEGDNATFSCLGTPERSTLYVRNVTMNMNGTVYTCVLQREIYCSRLIVKAKKCDKNHVFRGPADQTCEEGGNVTFQCDLPGPDTALWQIQPSQDENPSFLSAGRDILLTPPLGVKYKVFSKHKDISTWLTQLTILNVSLSMTGTYYRCLYHGGMARGRLTVTERQCSNAKKFQGPSDRVVEEGGNVSFRCNMDGPDISLWQHKPLGCETSKFLVAGNSILLDPPPGVHYYVDTNYGDNKPSFWFTQLRIVNVSVSMNRTLYKCVYHGDMSCGILTVLRRKTVVVPSPVSSKGFEKTMDYYCTCIIFCLCLWLIERHSSYMSQG